MAITKIDKTVIRDKNAEFKFDPMYGGIYKGAFDFVRIEWDAENDKNLRGYNVYFSMHPLLRYKVNTGLITDNYLEFNLPIFPQNQYFYFWVSKVVGAPPAVPDVEIFINEEGMTVINAQEKFFFDNTVSQIEPSYVFPETDMGNIEDAMKDVIKRIQVDTKFILQNDGVECDIFMRRWGSDYPIGVPCSCGDDSDADAHFRGRERCVLCFGTGIVGGFYPPVRMIIRFNEMPARDFKGIIRGLTVTQTYNAWSIPYPLLRAEDMIVRRYDGSRFVVKQVEIATQRNVATRQNLSLDLIKEMDIRRIVSLETINQAISKLQDPRYNSLERRSF